MELPAALARIFDLNYAQWNALDAASIVELLRAIESADAMTFPLPLPLFAPDKGTTQTIAIVHLQEAVAPSRELQQILEQMSVPLQVAVEREVIYRQLDMERQRIYERSIRDPLTGLFTRIYMQEAVQRLCDIQDRNSNSQVAVLMLDLDHFKTINDTFGHHQGDMVLQRVAMEIRDSIRTSDIPVRLGGEEFAIFTMGDMTANRLLCAERMRARIALLDFAMPMANWTVTVSIGVAVRRRREPLLDFIQRADAALYAAKHDGRDRVCIALDSASS